jgi:carboxymethylenebutenolidase
VPDIATKTIRCDGGLPAFVAMPAGEDKVPAVVLMHERYGLVKHTCDLAERLARDGFVCIAPDFFYKHPDQEALHRGDVGYPLKDTEAVGYLNSAIAELAKLPQVDCQKIVVKGVCQTGRHPLVLAAERKIAAALVWYGAASAREWQASDRYAKPLDDILARVDCPVLGIFGEADHVISLADVRRFRDSLDRHDKTYTIKVFADAPHGWLNDTMPGRYRREAAEAAWSLQLGFLKRVLDTNFDQTRRVQIYESEHAADYEFANNVRME